MMLSDAQNWSSPTGQKFSAAPPSERCLSAPSPSGELTEIEKLAILVHKIIQRRNRLSVEDISYHDEIQRGNEARLTGGLPFNYTMPKGRSIQHPIFREDSAISPIEFTAVEKVNAGISHKCLDANKTRTLGLCSEPTGMIHGTWPRNCKGHVSTVEKTDPTVRNHRDENVIAVSRGNKSDMPLLQVHGLSQVDVEQETPNSVSKHVDESCSPRIVEITVTKHPRRSALNIFQGNTSNFLRRNSTNPPLIASSCSAQIYQPTQNADSENLRTTRHVDAISNLNTGLATLTEQGDDGQESRDVNNNSVSPYDDLRDCGEDRSKDLVSVSASLIITYPFVRRALSIDNPYRRMICNPAVLGSSTRSPLRRTMSEESRRNAVRDTVKHGSSDTCHPLSPQVHTKPPIHRSNSCLSAFGNACLPISKSHKVNASNHGRSWYEGV